MSVRVDPKVDDFCDLMFRVLERLDGQRRRSSEPRLLPLSLKEAPTSFTKYPRLLLGRIQRYRNVEQGFDEWADKILRDASDSMRDEGFPLLMELKRWLANNRSLIEENLHTLVHLKHSMYGRIYTWLASRRGLVWAYVNAHRGFAGAFEKEFVENHFESDTEDEIRRLEGIYGSGEKLNGIVEDAKWHLISNINYYRRVALGAEKAQIEPSVAEEEPIDELEEIKEGDE